MSQSFYEIIRHRYSFRHSFSRIRRTPGRHTSSPLPDTLDNSTQIYDSMQKYVTKLPLMKSRYPNPMLDLSSTSPANSTCRRLRNTNYMATSCQQHYSTTSTKLTSSLFPRDSFVLCCVCNPVGLYNSIKLSPGLIQRNSTSDQKRWLEKNFVWFWLNRKNELVFYWPKKVLHGLMQKNHNFWHGVIQKITKILCDFERRNFRLFLRSCGNLNSALRKVPFRARTIVPWG